MSLSDALKEKVLDIRLRDKLMAEGKLNKSQLSDYVSSLADDESNSQPLYEKEESKEEE